MMPRLIVRLHRDIKDQLRWRSGVVGKNPDRHDQSTKMWGLEKLIQGVKRDGDHVFGTKNVEIITFSERKVDFSTLFPYINPMLKRDIYHKLLE